MDIPFFNKSVGEEMKNRVKGIRALVLAILLCILWGAVSNTLIKNIEAIKVRNLFDQVLAVVFFLFFVMLLKSEKMAVPKVTVSDIFMTGILVIVLIVSMISLHDSTIQIVDIANTFPGNHRYACYLETDTKGYDDIETALVNSIKKRKKKCNFDKLEEIYRMQTRENAFVYFRENEENIVEFAFLKQDGLYYGLGSTCTYVYDDKYTAEETVREDMVYSMGIQRGSYDKLIAPAWGVSTDDQIFSMTINSEKVDEVILIDEKDGKKYYFWIASKVGEIKTIEDVKEAEIKMDRL